MSTTETRVLAAFAARAVRNAIDNGNLDDSDEVAFWVLFVTGPSYNVLFLCTGNSARSIIAESLLNSMGNPRFRGYGAGRHPTGKINPYVAEYLASAGISNAGARSKSWHEFAI